MGGDLGSKTAKGGEGLTRGRGTEGGREKVTKRNKRLTNPLCRTTRTLAGENISREVTCKDRKRERGEGGPKIREGGAQKCLHQNDGLRERKKAGYAVERLDECVWGKGGPCLKGGPPFRGWRKKGNCDYG